jgi:hypothetical protein
LRDLLLAWLTLWPSCRPLPQTSQTRDITALLSVQTEKSGANYAKVAGGMQGRFSEPRMDANWRREGAKNAKGGRGAPEAEPPGTRRTRRSRRGTRGARCRPFRSPRSCVPWFIVA